VALTTIIVHGTWASGSDWWKQVPGTANFWSYIGGLTATLYGAPDAFAWTGANQHVDRVAAAVDLKSWCASHGVTRLQAIAHSHGVNVCLIASRLGLVFENLIGLATPVRFDYVPDMRNIRSLVNLYSEYDSVQTPLATLGYKRGEGRTLADADVMINQHVPYYSTVNTAQSVGHSDLHEQAVWQGNGLEPYLIVA
jgi:hypothetical protein